MAKTGTSIADSQLPGGSDYVPGAGAGGSTIPTNPTPVNTSQPQPTSTNPTPTIPGNGAINPATGLLEPAQPTATQTPVTGTLPGQTTPTTFQSADIAKQYGAALAQTKATTPTAPQTSAEAGQVVQNALKANPIAPSTANIDTALTNDPGYQQILADRAEYNNVANQSKSLLDFYNQATKDAGIPALNAQLLNYEKIINGTEDSIRQEIQASGGMANEGQILSLSLSRNKQLVQNYNNLLASKNMAMESINNMVGLASQDRQFALQSIMQKLNIDQQILEYRDKFINNAIEEYDRIINAVGYQGLLQSLDPSEVPLVERTLGFQPGQLQQLASYTQNQQNLQEIQAAGITTPYVNVNGEIRDVNTGAGFINEDDFQQKTGLTLAQAGERGLITKYGGDLDTQLKKAAVDEIPLDRQLKQAQINATNRSNTGGSGGSGTGVLGLSNQQIDNVSPLVTQFQNNDIVKNYNTIGEQINAVRSAGSTPTDDIQRIYAFAKVMDPNSVVREGEYKTIQDYSQALLQKYGLEAKRVFTNSGFLTNEARGFLLKTLENRFKASETSYKNLSSETARRINLIGNTDKGEQLLNNYGGAFVQSSTPVMGPPAPNNDSISQTNEPTSFLDKVSNWLWGED